MDIEFLKISVHACAVCTFTKVLPHTKEVSERSYENIKGL